MTLHRLIETANHPDVSARRQAVNDLAQYREPEAIEALIRALQDESRAVADRAVNSLIKIGGAEVARAITPLINHEEITLRSLALDVAIGLGADSGPILVELMSSRDRELRKSAAEVLTISGYRQAEQFLRPCLKDPDPVVRQAVVAALTGLRCTEAVDEMIDTLATEPAEWVRFALASAIGQLGSKEQVDQALAIEGLDELTAEFIQSEYESRGAA